MNGLMRSIGVLTLVGALLGTAGCGGSGDDGAARSVPPVQPGSGAASAPAQPGPASTPVTKDQLGPAADAQKKLAACLRKEGINKVPTSMDKLSPKEQAAVQTCGLAAIGGLDPNTKSKLDALRDCMRKQGLSVPEPDRPYIPDVRDPKVAAALRVCQPQNTQ